MDIEDVRSFERGGEGAYILTGARKAEFYAHFADKESPPRDTCRVLSAKGGGGKKNGEIRKEGSSRRFRGEMKLYAARPVNGAH